MEPIISPSDSIRFWDSNKFNLCSKTAITTSSPKNGDSIVTISNSTNNKLCFGNTRSSKNENELKRELDLKTMEVVKKNEEIEQLKHQVIKLSEQYSQELSICCNYSNNLSTLQKDFINLKYQYDSKEEQYKKQIQDLQKKIYSNDSFQIDKE
ncbi:hypothetical protein DLAC_04006 [Tieghemostelium lacteum]|uniref:Uncharacterized protein n=1 Tax=Tieghemostelium lacteum TaxID=361077 RepID=A0A151ZRT6_TIELA|nr:hypothetical protein DLAC_04006 [Tieghemostelium lacteum]|eukprot:KYQ96713.1 hypothetical protein DLAC_04006 [Tieghemostelium lacteum]